MRIRAVVLALATLSAPVLAEQKPAVADVLKATGDYLSQYAQQLNGVAAEEEYVQRELSSTMTKKLSADVIFAGYDGGAVVMYRDIFALDGHGLRQRDDRLAKLLAAPASLQNEAAALEEDGARQYLSPNLRVMDKPFLALEFLRGANQAKSEFTLDGVKTQDGVQVATLKWKMKNASELLPLPEGVEGNGKFTIEVATGAVRQTEIAVGTKLLLIRINTKYAKDAALGLWVPKESVQQFEMSSGGGGMSNMGAGGNMGSRVSLEGRSYYSKYRRLTSEK